MMGVSLGLLSGAILARFHLLDSASKQWRSWRPGVPRCSDSMLHPPHPLEIHAGGQNAGSGSDESEEGVAAELSTHERRQRKIAAQIAQIEEEAMQDRSWHMRGEATAATRPKDSALEIDVVRTRTAFGVFALLCHHAPALRLESCPAETHSLDLVDVVPLPNCL